MSRDAASRQYVTKRLEPIVHDLDTALTMFPPLAIKLDVVTSREQWVCKWCGDLIADSAAVKWLPDVELAIVAHIRRRHPLRRFFDRSVRAAFAQHR